jgi:hypothetical protein
MYFDYMYSDIFDRKNQCIRKPCIENGDLINRLVFFFAFKNRKSLLWNISGLSEVLRSTSNGARSSGTKKKTLII